MISRRYLHRTFRGLLVMGLTFTAFLTIFHLMGYQSCHLPQHEQLSVDNIDHSLLDFVSRSRVLRSNIQAAFYNETLSIANDTVTILEDIKMLNIAIQKIEADIDKRARRLLLSQPIINYHNFSYIHNPMYYCIDNKVNLIIVIPSAAINFSKRQMSRDSQKGQYVRNVSDAKILFFLGQPEQVENSADIQKAINAESRKFGDIVQEDFEDVYKNNRLKSVSMLRWISTYCSNANYVLRTDDDIDVNVSAVLAVLYRTSSMLHNFILGKKRINDPPRRDNCKYYISEMDYPYPVFPPYLLGGLLGYPTSTGKLLYEAALRVQPIWLEDVYITGICAAKMHVPILQEATFVFEHE